MENSQAFEDYVKGGISIIIFCRPPDEKTLQVLGRIRKGITELFFSAM